MKTNEHYKQMILANAGISNKIYLTTSNKDGSMSMKRRDFTEEVLRSAVGNMMGYQKDTGRAVFSWEVNEDEKATLAYIPNHLHNNFLDWCDEVGYKTLENANEN